MIFNNVALLVLHGNIALINLPNSILELKKRLTQSVISVHLQSHWCSGWEVLGDFWQCGWLVSIFVSVGAVMYKIYGIF